MAVALVATLVIGSNALRHSPTPARTRPAPSVVPPSPRFGAGVVYDGAHSELILFGGAGTSGGVVNDTWTWDGKSWRVYHLALAPAPRTEAAMAFDQMHGNVVLFGGMARLATSGTAGQSAVDDTWTWDGSAWKELHPKHEPSLDYSWPPAMQYDLMYGKIILFGFKKTASESLTNMTPQTWVWDGSDWTLTSPAASPTQLGELVAYRGHVYLMAFGSKRVGGRYVTDIWRWDRTTWTLVESFARPFGALMVEDEQRGSLVAFDGDTWVFDGSTWSRQHPQTVPPSAGYMAYFAPLHEVVMWGDRAGTTSNDLWAWDGSEWKQVAAGTTPPISPLTGRFGPEAPAVAESFIRQTVKTASPVLLPTSLPAGLDASGVATADFFDVDYRTDQQDRTISLSIGLAQPPPGDEHSSDTRVPFRNSIAQKYGTPGQAEYFVYDPSSPRSDRWLIWTEPGQVSSNIGGPGVPYFLFASGLTDAEFWQVANSLR